MVLEFLVDPDNFDFPKKLIIPNDFMGYDYDGRRFVYLTNTNRMRYKVRFVIKRDGRAILEGKRWDDFARDVFDPSAIKLHFIQEGDYSFYVTAYVNFGNELCGYDDLEGRMARCLCWVVDDEFEHMTVPVEFLSGLNVEDTIVIDVEEQHYFVRVRRVEAVVGTNLFAYEFNIMDWYVNVGNHELESGMLVVFTKKTTNCIHLNAFDEDGDQITTGGCLGVTTLVQNQPQLSYDEEGDYMLKHVCQWAYHKNHFGEKDKSAFFKWFPLITCENRLKIPASFLKSYPMHMYDKCFIRHQDIEIKMRIKMDFHWEDPKRVNNVGVYGSWEEFGEACGFDKKKILRFKFMYTITSLDDDDDEGQFPVFEVC